MQKSEFDLYDKKRPKIPCNHFIYSKDMSRQLSIPFSQRKQQKRKKH